MNQNHFGGNNNGSDSSNNNNSNRGNAINPQHQNLFAGLPQNMNYLLLNAARQQLGLGSNFAHGGRDAMVHPGYIVGNRNSHDQVRRIYRPTANDVLFGRGRPLQQHPGNLRFHKIINRNRQPYMNSRKEDKVRVAKKVLHEIKSTINSAGDNDTPGGRFLKRTDIGEDFWVEVSTEASIEKISHALRGRPRSESRNYVGRESKSGSSKRQAMDSSSSSVVTSAAATVNGGEDTFTNHIKSSVTGNGERGSNSLNESLNAKQVPSLPIQESTTVASSSSTNNTGIVNLEQSTMAFSSQPQLQETMTNQRTNLVSQQQLLQPQAIQMPNQFGSQQPQQQQQVLQQIGDYHPLLNHQIQNHLWQQSVQSQVQNILQQAQQPHIQHLALQQQQQQQQQQVNQDLQFQLSSLGGPQQHQLHQPPQQQQNVQVPPSSSLSSPLFNNALNAPKANSNRNANIVAAAPASATNGSAINVAGGNLYGNGVIPASNNMTEQLILTAIAMLGSQQQQSPNALNPQLTREQQQQQQLSQSLLLAALMQGKEQNQQQSFQNHQHPPPPPPSVPPPAS